MKFLNKLVWDVPIEVVLTARKQLIFHLFNYFGASP